MKRQLSLKLLLALLLAMSGQLTVKGQFTIQTNYAPPPVGNNVPFRIDTEPGFQTFSVINHNTYPVAVLDVGYYHVDSMNFGTVSNPRPWSANGAYYSLWVKKNPVAGPPVPISTTNGWELVSTFGPVTTSANGIISITPGINVIVPPGQRHQYAVVTDTLLAQTALDNGPPQVLSFPSPASHSANNVEMVTGANAGEYWGVYPHLVQHNNDAQYHAYWGSITVIESPTDPPTLSVSANPACEGDDVTLTAVAPSYAVAPIITWYYGGVQVGNGPTLTLTNVQASQSGMYSATVTDAGKTSKHAQINVTILNTPEPTIITGRSTYCENEQFEPITPTGINIKWYTSPDGVIGTIIPPYVNTQIAGSYTFFATQTVSGCESEKVPYTITVAPRPSAPIVTSPTGACENETPDALTAIGDNLKWYYAPSGGVPSLVAPIYSTGKLDTFSFWVTQTVDGCEGPRARLDAIVTFKPNGLINVSRDSLCQKQELTLEYYGSGLPNSAYNWGLPTGASLIEGSEAGPLRVRFDSAGLQTVTLQVGNIGCYSDVYTQEIDVNKIPEVILATVDDICQNKSEMIGVYEYTRSIETFNWDFDGGVVSHSSTDQGPYAVSWSTPGKKVIELQVIDKLCEYTTHDTIEVHASPDASIVVADLQDNQTVCTGDSVKMSARTIEPASEYVWTPARFFDYDNLPVVYARLDYENFVTLNVVDEYGCKNADSVLIKTEPCCDVFFPNAFSPNGDAHNEWFRMLSEGINEIGTFKIANRWGNIVFETSDAHRGWDGNFNGEPQDMGTYFYYLRYKCNGVIKDVKGELTLIR